MKNISTILYCLTFGTFLHASAPKKDVPKIQKPAIKEENFKTPTIPQQEPKMSAEEKVAFELHIASLVRARRGYFD